MTKPVRLAAAAAVLLAAAPAAAQNLAVRYIGQQTLPAGAQRLGTTVGGLSGVDYDAANDSYIAISDDPSATGPARFYNLDFQLSQTSFGGVTVAGVGTLRTPDGSAYALNGVDPEAIRYGSPDSIFYASEGFVATGVQPFVREAGRDGSYIHDLMLPSYYAAGPGVGIRNNLAFESLMLSNDGRQVIVATENALAQDGPAATLTTGSPSRILFLDRATGMASAEYVYGNDPLAESPVPATNFGVNGLVELVASGDGYLALERSFSVGAPGTGYSIKLYGVDFAGATDVLGVTSLTGQAYTAVTKTLLFDFATLGVPLDNLEGVTFGERLANGNRSLIVVGDDNFSSSQFQQFLAFEVAAVPEPATWAMMLAGFGGLGAALRRRSTPARPALRRG